MRYTVTVLSLLIFSSLVQAQAIQKTECFNASTCALPNPVSSGDMLVVIGGLPGQNAISGVADAQGDTFFEIPAAGWYANGAPMWYSTGVHGGSITVTSTTAVGTFYLAEYPPATVDQIAPQVFQCCGPASISITTALPNELLIEWTIFPSSVAVQDSDVATGFHSIALPSSGAYGAELVSFRLLGPEFAKYKPPYTPIQIKGCIGTSCQFDNPVSNNDLLIAAVSEIGCTYVGSVQQPGCVTDSQANAWIMAVPIPYDGSIWYVLNAKPGITGISVGGSSSSTSIIIAEYPPAVAFEGANYGTYQTQDLDGPQGGSDDVGWSLPVQTTKPCDLLVSMGINNIPLVPGSSWTPNPVPFFTVRMGFADRIGLEDGTSAMPGVYIASMDFHDYSHWTEGLAAFDMNGCK